MPETDWLYIEMLIFIYDTPAKKFENPWFGIRAGSNE